MCSSDLEPYVYCYCDNGRKGRRRRKYCVEFCDEYYKANGEEGPSCSERKRCDECSDCDNGDCEKKTGSSPCHCNSTTLGFCEYCKPDGTVGRRENNCAPCCTRSKKCCNDETVSIRSCGWSSIENLCKYAQEAVERECRKKSCDNPDELPECRGSCEDYVEEQPPGPCSDPAYIPSGLAVTITGCIEGPDSSFLLYSNCAPGAEAETDTCCPPPECNCHSDCEEGEFCSGATGKCQSPAPEPETP